MKTYLLGTLKDIISNSKMNREGYIVIPFTKSRNILVESGIIFGFIECINSKMLQPSMVVNFVNDAGLTGKNIEIMDYDILDAEIELYSL